MRGFNMEVKFPYTRKYRDRHGKVRIEYRRGGRTIPIRGAPGTTEFQIAYEAARTLFENGCRRTGARSASGNIEAGTLRWLCTE
jgi:hypothetical protein